MHLLVPGKPWIFIQPLYHLVCSLALVYEACSLALVYEAPAPLRICIMYMSYLHFADRVGGVSRLCLVVRVDIVRPILPNGVILLVAAAAS